MSIKMRPVAIDCANVACQYLYNANWVGDSRGPIEAYRYWSEKGRKVKVFVKQYRVTNRNEDEIMDNIGEFLSVIPSKDRPVVPSDGDDDSYFIKWSVENDAILITNDLLRDHHHRLSGEELERFEEWLSRSRCGFTFIDDEFFPDPNFGIQDATAAIPSGESIQSGVMETKSSVQEKSEINPKHTHVTVRKRIEIESEELLEFEKLSREERSLKNSENEEDLSELKLRRNSLNDEVRVALSRRNSLNDEVKEKIREIKVLKDKRNIHNSEVEKLKAARSSIDSKWKAAKKSLEQGLIQTKEYNEIGEKQNAAHKKVMAEVVASNDCHKAMTEISDMVDVLKLEANEAHELAMRKKEEADEIHNEYMEKLARKFAFERIIRNDSKLDSDTTEPAHGKPESDDSSTSEDHGTLFKVVDGESNQELADLLEHRSKKDLASELDDIFRQALATYEPKSKRRKHIIDRVDHEYHIFGNTLQVTSTTGWFLGTLGANIQTIRDAMMEKYGLDVKINLKKSKTEAKGEEWNAVVSRNNEKIISGKSVKDLRMIAKERGLSGYSNLKKTELISLINDSTTKSVEIHDLTIDDVKLDKAAGEAILRKTENIDLEEFFQCLFSHIQKSGEWSALATPYAHMVAEKPEFRLHSMGVKLTDFLRLHRDRVELGQRKGHPWIREKSC